MPPAAMTRITVLLLALALLVPGRGLAAPSPAPAADPPSLRVETGRHSAPINRLGVDPAERWFATTSYDKTVRLWSLDGRPLRTLRLPIGPEDEGSLYGIAVSPDGRTLAYASIMPDLDRPRRPGRPPLRWT